MTTLASPTRIARENQQLTFGFGSRGGGMWVWMVSKLKTTLELELAT